MKTHRIDKHITNLRFALMQKKADRNALKLDFNGENRAAIVTPINGEFGEMGIIMPIKVL